MVCLVIVVLVGSGGSHFLDTDNINVVSVGHDNINVVSVSHDLTDRVFPLNNFDSPEHGTSAGLDMRL